MQNRKSPPPGTQGGGDFLFFRFQALREKIITLRGARVT